MFVANAHVRHPGYMALCALGKTFLRRFGPN